MKNSVSDQSFYIKSEEEEVEKFEFNRHEEDDGHDIYTYFSSAENLQQRKPSSLATQWPQSYSSVTSPTIGFVGTPTLLRLGSSFLSSSLTRRFTPETQHMLARKPLLPLSVNDEIQLDKRSMHSLVTPAPPSRRTSMRFDDKVYEVDHAHGPPRGRPCAWTSPWSPEYLWPSSVSPCRDSIVNGSVNHHTMANDCPTSRIGIEYVKMALRKMGRDKVIGPDQIPITVWLALGEEGVKWLTNIFNIILETANMPEEWRESTVIPIYKNKGDPQSCGRSTTEAIHLLRRLMEKYRGKIEIFTWHSLTLRMLGDTETFPMEIRLHQGSSLSPYIFALIMEDIYCVTPDGVPWCMLFADDIILVVETKTELNKCWAIKKDHVRRMEAAEMRMLRWAYGRTLWDMTPNSAIRMSLGVVHVSEKLREGRLRWFGHVLRRQPSDAVRRVESIIVDGARRRRRPRRKWVDCLRSDLKDLALIEYMTSDRKVWRLKTRGFVVVVVVVALLSYYTSMLLCQCLDSSPELKTYPDIGQAAFGTAGRITLSLSFS
ncbi:Transmembrane amino acid transporter family protein isoform 3 [Hibiscus syriacus]|uniref:Transmembrane amino acid transporter family protein isoform 3 n=1 Tax=Hibiscus syriacus TaxID=106335 RepID=A0A6A2YW62_HIBSY|nr:Transmembrane amino acid transporter family protein isoform 3 [Hibiscus syriacus]